MLWSKELNSIETLRMILCPVYPMNSKHLLATIKDMYNCYKPQISDEERQIFLYRIIESITQLSQLTENILKLNKLENQRIQLEKKEYRLDEQIEK